MKPVNLGSRKVVLWNLTSKDILLFIAFYSVMAVLYWMALYITSSGSFNSLEQTSVNYTFKLIWAVPVYWLIFWRLLSWPLWKRLALHIVTMPLYILLWRESFYATMDRFFATIGHMQGPGSFWDIYIGGLLYIVTFGAFHIYENYKQLKGQQEKEKLLETLAHISEMNALKAQIQPHFLFNSLNSISASVPKDMEHTRELIARLADTFRFALHNSTKETISLKEELTFIKAYLDLEKERFSDRLEIEYNIDEKLLDSAIPPMLLQPLVENALRHGIAKSIEGGRIGITIQEENKYIKIIVTDSGVGLNGITSAIALEKGIGLKTTNLRLKKLYGDGIGIENNYPSGLKISFRIPALINHE